MDRHCQSEKKEGGSIRQIVCNNKATLIYLVNQGTVSLHPYSFSFGILIFLLDAALRQPRSHFIGSHGFYGSAVFLWQRNFFIVQFWKITFSPRILADPQLD